MWSFEDVRDDSIDRPISTRKKTKGLRLNKRGVFFDLYGTLLVYGDMRLAWSDWLDAFYRKLEPLGLLLSRDAFSTECDRFFEKQHIPEGGDGMSPFEYRIHSLCGRIGVDPPRNEIEHIADHIADVWEQHVKIDDEALEVLRSLDEDKVLALISNFDHPRHIRRVMARHRLIPFFDSVVISGEVGIQKPDPRIFHLALHEARLTADDVVYVGDTRDDVGGARAAGIIPILIQRPDNATTLDALDFRSNRPASDTGHVPGGDDIIVRSLRELLVLLR